MRERTWPSFLSEHETARNQLSLPPFTVPRQPPSYDSAAITISLFSRSTRYAFRAMSSSSGSSSSHRDVIAQAKRVRLESSPRSPLMS